jgi:hypothetical protein
MPQTKLIERDPFRDILPDEAELDAKLSAAAADYIHDALKRGARIGAAEIGISPSFDVLNPEVISWLQKYTGLMANTVNRHLVENIRGALEAGIENGETFGDMRGRVLEAMGAVRDDAGKIVADDKLTYRAEMISRTETDRAQNAGRQEQLQEAGAKVKRWRANPGACEFCAELDGTEIGVEETFFDRGSQMTVTSDDGEERNMLLDYSDTEYPPLHPNCTCIAEYDL